MEEVQVSATVRDNNLHNDKKKSEMDKMVCSLADNIKALAECMTKPKSIKVKFEDNSFAIGEELNLKQTEHIAKPMIDQLEEEIIIIDEIKPKQLPNSNRMY